MATTKEGAAAIAVKSGAEAPARTYVHKFAKPFTYNGKEYGELAFDWDSLTGRDSLDIEAEISQLMPGKIIIAEELSAEYLIRFAAKCCEEKIGSDAFELMPLRDYKAIKGKARGFLVAQG
jgi:hypothetical protein